MVDKDYYKILQVDPSAEPEVIDAAYKRLALKYHPDTNKSQDSKSRMREINLAYEILRNPQTKASYAAELTKAAKRVDYKQSLTESQNSIADKNLLLHSDFNLFSLYWEEGSSQYHEAFRRDGYYHIKVFGKNSYRYQGPNFFVTNFYVSVNAQFTKGSNKNSSCGLVFRANQGIHNNDEMYVFNISPNGYYRLSLLRNYNWHTIIKWQYTHHIRSDYSSNSLFVEMVENKIKLGVNGLILANISDNNLSRGLVGLFVMANNYVSEAHARFSDFRLYSIGSLHDTFVNSY